MSELALALEATALAQFLKASQWVYPFINAGHILGIALLIGAVVPLDLTLTGIVKRLAPAAATALLLPFAVAGLLLAAGFGALLFITQASDYVGNPLFLVKIGLIGLAVLNASLHARIGYENVGPGGRALALVSLILWPLVLVLGRLVGYSIG